jgi:hypothetical protein
MDLPTYHVEGRDELPLGILVKTNSYAADIRYAIVPAGEAQTSVRGGYIVEQVEIGGVPVELGVPPDFSDPDDSHRLSAAFQSVPGDDSQQFGIEFNGTGLQGDLYDEARAIIESVRYAPPPPAPPALPAPQVTPGPDWVRIVAYPKTDPDYEVFSVLAPPGWEFVPAMGLDSFVGGFTNGEISINFDYGSLSSGPVSYGHHLRDPDYVPAHRFWIETIEGKPFIMFKPVSDEPHERAYTGISVDRIPGVPDLVMPDGSFSSSIFDCGGSFWARTADRDDQELVLAILRTLRAEENAEGCR